jgi:hypothetical protein
MLMLPLGFIHFPWAVREATRGTAYLSTDIRPGEAGRVCAGRSRV